MSDRENMQIYQVWQFNVLQEKKRLKQKIAKETHLFTEKRNIFKIKTGIINPFKEEAWEFERFATTSRNRYRRTY